MQFSSSAFLYLLFCPFQGKNETLLESKSLYLMWIPCFCFAISFVAWDYLHRIAKKVYLGKIIMAKSHSTIESKLLCEGCNEDLLKDILLIRKIWLHAENIRLKDK